MMHQSSLFPSRAASSDSLTLLLVDLVLGVQVDGGDNDIGEDVCAPNQVQDIWVIEGDSL